MVSSLLLSQKFHAEEKRLCLKHISSESLSVFHLILSIYSSPYPPPYQLLHALNVPSLLTFKPLDQTRYKCQHFDDDPWAFLNGEAPLALCVCIKMVKESWTQSRATAWHQHLAQGCARAVPGKAQVTVPATHLGDLDGILSYWLCPGPTQAAVSIY